MALFGLRDSYKDDIGGFSAERFHRATLMLPGKAFIEQRREAMRTLRAVQAAHHCQRKVFRSKSLETYTHVFHRVDSVRKSLVQP